MSPVLHWDCVSADKGAGGGRSWCFNLFGEIFIKDAPMVLNGNWNAILMPILKTMLLYDDHLYDDADDPMMYQYSGRGIWKVVNVTRVLGSQTCLEIIILANIGIVSVRSYNNGSIFSIIRIFSSFFLPIIIVIVVISIVIIAFVNIVITIINVIIVIIIISMEPCQLWVQRLSQLFVWPGCTYNQLCCKDSDDESLMMMVMLILMLVVMLMMVTIRLWYEWQKGSPCHSCSSSSPLDSAPNEKFF